jgi:hypothetical protein
MQTINDCQLEWDNARGVLYVHNKATGRTVLRICRLEKKDILHHLEDGMIDITGPFEHASYPEPRPRAGDWPPKDDAL